MEAWSQLANFDISLYNSEFLLTLHEGILIITMAFPMYGDCISPQYVFHL